MNLIVRVKRRRSQEPSDSLWVVDDSGPTKKRPNTTRELTQCLTGLSTSSASAQTEDGIHAPAPTTISRVFLRRVQTVEMSAAPIMDLQTLTASSESSSSIIRGEKRARTDDEDAEVTESSEEVGIDGKSSSSSSAGPNSSSSNKVLITNSKKVLRNKDTSEKFIVVDMAQIACSSSNVGSGVSTTGSNRLSSGSSSSSSGGINTKPSSPEKAVIPKGTPTTLLYCTLLYSKILSLHVISCTLSPLSESSHHYD